MTTDLMSQRQALVDASLQAVALRLSTGTAGNISLRHGDGMLITPTGIDPGEMRAEQIVAVDLDGNWSGSWKPSSEWSIHAQIYRNTDAQAVVHAHPDYCVALACLRQPLPPFHYMVAGFGGNEVPCARYEPFGSPALADAVLEALGSRYNACLMANHGITTFGADLRSALRRAERLETLARQYLLARAAGEPVLLTPADLSEVHGRYATYGKQPKG